MSPEICTQISGVWGHFIVDNFVNSVLVIYLVVFFFTLSAQNNFPLHFFFLKLVGSYRNLTHIMLDVLCTALLSNFIGF